MCVLILAGTNGGPANDDDDDDDEDDDDNDDEDEEEAWTLRKCAALGLDALAASFQVPLAEPHSHPHHL